MGIKDDLDLHGDQYQWLGSLFYFGLFFLPDLAVACLCSDRL
jgi:hypothetical protein